MSIKEDVVETYVQHGMVKWVLRLLDKSKRSEIHIFSLDFSSALLANILNSPTTYEYLDRNPTETKDIMVQLLTLLKENIPTSVLMHILICLSYLSKERFSQAIEETNFVDKISDFVEYYSQLNVTDADGSEIDKKTVLDLCAHMFHPKDQSNDVSQTMEYNELKQEERIKEFENA